MKNIEELIQTAEEVYKKGLVSGKAGNISARFNKVIAITPTLKSLNNLKEEDIVLVDLEGNILTKGKPSSEIGMHLEIYKKRSDVGAIIHTHSPYATGFAFSDKRLRRLEGFGEIKHEYIPSVDYEKPGSEALALSVGENIAGEDILILKNHGVICVSNNTESDLYKYYPQMKQIPITVIYHGSEINPVSGEELHLEKKYIL